MDSASGHHSVHSSADELSIVVEHSNDTDGEDAEADKHRTKTISDDAAASDGEEEPEPPSTQDTLTRVSQVFGMHEDSDSESDTGEEIPSKQRKQPRRLQKRTAL